MTSEPIRDALRAAEQSAFTRPIPSTTRGQIGFLARQVKGSARGLAGVLGISERQARRYMRGEVSRPNKTTAERIRQEAERRWQPRVQAAARKRAGQAGLVVELRGRIGYDAPIGTTDDARIRRLTVALPGPHVRQLVDARTEAERREALADGLADVYFRDGGRRAHGLGVRVTDIDYVDVEFL